MIPSVETRTFRIAVLSGAGGGVPDLRAFCATSSAMDDFAPLTYPGWQRYAEEGFCARALLEDLANDIARLGRRVAILGVSLGGHLGYGVALRLQQLDVEVVGLCAVNSFIISSTDMRPGSTLRHFSRLRTLAQSGSIERIGIQVRSLFWRALLRLAGDNVMPLLRRWNKAFLFRAACHDPVFESELNMRLLMRATAPWLRGLDNDPSPLKASAALLRTASAAAADAAWRIRCPEIQIIEIPGDHDSLLDLQNHGRMRTAFASAIKDWR